ncbi:hypothetical protein F6R97_04245 [Pseudomonas sp. JV414]|uniref:hypothetical protein n=1 Tax=Pseudomonas sp. JV414 TaxID=1733110 RepID=UPI0028E11095|nr:hypothetical protein [Pseudomonas sp. JV414]MDT9673865.1 hypothetical protein [Pseudomonas sp. JV414]
MKVDAYMSNPRKKLLLVLPGKDISELPAEVQKFAQDLKLHDQWDLVPTAPRVGLNIAEAIESVNAKGYYASTAEVRVEMVE